MSKVYNWTKKIDSNELKECSNIIKSGGIVVFPTETVYGIGTNAFIEESIKKIYEIKKRPLEKICSILIANKKDIIKYANICNDVEKKIINNFMPGPITIILQKKEGVLEYVTGNKETIGIRIPQNEIILEILKEVNIPILAPSANISGETSGTNINEIMEKFEDKVKPGGILIYDGYGIMEPPTRKDIQVYRIDAMDEANERGMAKTFNMIVLGGLLKLRPIVEIESVLKALRKTLPERHHKLIPMNEEALRIGMDIIKPVEV